MITGAREGGDRSRNGLVPATFKPYVYRGNQRGLTAEECAEDEVAPETDPTGRWCLKCCYVVTSRNHKILCLGRSR